MGVADDDLSAAKAPLAHLMYNGGISLFRAAAFVQQTHLTFGRGHAQHLDVQQLGGHASDLGDTAVFHQIVQAVQQE